MERNTIYASERKLNWLDVGDFIEDCCTGALDCHIYLFAYFVVYLGRPRRLITAQPNQPHIRKRDTDCQRRLARLEVPAMILCR